MAAELVCPLSLTGLTGWTAKTRDRSGSLSASIALTEESPGVYVGDMSGSAGYYAALVFDDSGRLRACSDEFYWNGTAVDDPLPTGSYTAPDNSGVLSAIAELNDLAVADVQTALADYGASTFDASTDQVTAANMRGTDNALLATNYTAPDNGPVLTAISGLNNLAIADVETALTSYGASTLAQSDILSDATPFAGANIDAAISSISGGEGGDATAANQALIFDAIAGLNDLALADVETALANYGASTFNANTDQVTAANMRGTDNALLANSYTAPANGNIAAIKNKTDALTFADGGIVATVTGVDIDEAAIAQAVVNEFPPGFALTPEAVAQVREGLASTSDTRALSEEISQTLTKLMRLLELAEGDEQIRPDRYRKLKAGTDFPLLEKRVTRDGDNVDVRAV